jgi:hypothetical protein
MTADTPVSVFSDSSIDGQSFAASAGRRCRVPQLGRGTQKIAAVLAGGPANGEHYGLGRGTGRRGVKSVTAQRS